MRPRLAAALLAATLAAAPPAFAQEITGAGATFPAPLYARWGELARAAIGIRLNYQAIGSSGGVNQILSGTVDFGASDVPVPAEKLTAAGLLQLPAVLGAVVPVVNVPGVADGGLRLDGETVAAIYLGAIARWNDPRIAALNPGVALPGIGVAPVYRAEGSGTTFVWTSWLAATSPAWRSAVGTGTSVRWPAGVGARGNDGVGAIVRTIPGAIGYVESAFATINHLATARLRNRDGAFVAPTMESFAAAAAAADWAGAAHFAVDLIDQPGAGAWPIVTATFILLPTAPPRAARSGDVMRFFDWAWAHGGAAARALDYVPLPEGVQDAARAAWAKGSTAPGRAVPKP